MKTIASKAVVLPLLCIVFISLIDLPLSLGANNGLALTPPMGWIDWVVYECSISESLFTTTADLMVSEGYLSVGYNHVNLDDCWMSPQRSSSGQLVANPSLFPHGISWLANYMHSRGLLLGIYEDFGNQTCAGYPGSQFHEKIDADTFASWGIDMLKLDGCNVIGNMSEQMNIGYPKMAKDLLSTGRQIVYSCSWPDYLRAEGDPIPWKSIVNSCNLWRLYRDIRITWDSIKGIIQYWGDNQDVLIPNAGPGAWNDPDMLVIGNPGITHDEEQSQMAMWAIWAAPLMMSNDLKKVPAESKAILQNKEIIAVDQDVLGIQGRMILRNGTTEVWRKPLHSGNFAVVLGNWGDKSTVEIQVELKAVGIASGKARVRDLINHIDLGHFTGSFSAKVNPHGVAMLKMTPLPSSAN